MSGAEQEQRQVGGKGQKFSRLRGVEQVSPWTLLLGDCAWAPPGGGWHDSTVHCDQASVSASPSPSGVSDLGGKEHVIPEELETSGGPIQIPA